MSALTRNRADVSTTPNEIMKEYYMQRAMGGCGLIVTEGTLITRQGCVCPKLAQTRANFVNQNRVGAGTWDLE
jgi:2,4-dienoyl-CoA reductase-like NADH-dependent reductase (Old Yellow Enzyme family)